MLQFYCKFLKNRFIKHFSIIVCIYVVNDIYQNDKIVYIKHDCIKQDLNKYIFKLECLFLWIKCEMEYFWSHFGN